MDNKSILSLIFFVSLLFSYACGNENATLGDRLFEQGKYREAITAYNEYLSLQPNHFKSIYNRGRAYEELGDYDRALEDFREALEIDKKNTSVYLSIGNYYYRNHQYDIAAYNFEKGVENNDSHAEARYLWGRALHQLGKFPQAMEQYNLAISLNRDLGDAYLHRGVLHTALKSNRKACADFRSAQALNVEDAKEALSKYCP